MREEYAGLMAKLTAAPPVPDTRRATPLRYATPAPPTPQPAPRPPLRHATLAPPTPQPTPRPPPQHAAPAAPASTFHHTMNNGKNDLEWIQLADGSFRSIQKYPVRDVLARPPPRMVEASQAGRPVSFRAFLTEEQRKNIEIPKEILTHGAGFNGYGTRGFGYTAASKSMEAARTHYHVMRPNWGLTTAYAQSAGAPCLYIAASAAKAEAPEPQPPAEIRTEWQMPTVLDDCTKYHPYTPSSGPIITGADYERIREREAMRAKEKANFGPRHLLRGKELVSI